MNGALQFLAFGIDDSKDKRTYGIRRGSRNPGRSASVLTGSGKPIGQRKAILGAFSFAFLKSKDVLPPRPLAAGTSATAISLLALEPGNLFPLTAAYRSHRRRIKPRDLPKGVYRRRKSIERPYYSVIQKNGTRYDLGTFTTKDEAADAYRAKAKELYGEPRRVRQLGANFNEALDLCVRICFKDLFGKPTPASALTIAIVAPR